jgi:anti-sigma regulatory factor (Ser/Thr protein kinase)
MPSFRIDVDLPATPTAARQARRALADSGQIDPAEDHVLLLLVSELVTNSVRHAGLHDHERIRLIGRFEGDCARIEVLDSGHGDHEPEVRRSALTSVEPGGYGLRLVDALAHRWGVDHPNGATCVWFELERSHWIPRR